MQISTLMSAFVLAAVVMLTAPPAADAVCCVAYENYCKDGTLGTPYCGKGPCNMFACNCDGGCRTREDAVDAINDASERLRAYELVSAGDLNGDGLLSIYEAETMLEQGPNAVHRRSVRSLDKNLDGMLSVDEIDN